MQLQKLKVGNMHVQVTVRPDGLETTVITTPLGNKMHVYHNVRKFPLGRVLKNGIVSPNQASDFAWSRKYIDEYFRLLYPSIPPHFNVAGVTFEGRQNFIKNLNKDSVFFLVPEPDNEYDPNAVKVIADCECIGYVPRDLAPTVAWLLKHNRLQVSPNGTVHGGFAEGISFGVKVELKILSK
jgi:hypothetical protein